jgi:hypothetical protein
MMQRRLSPALFTAILCIVPHAAQAGSQCACRHADGKTPLGQTACIRTPNGPQMATCEMVLNNTSWKLTDRLCPSAGLSPRAGAESRG